MIQPLRPTKRNEPRFFANSGFIDDEGVSFNKGIFTPCQNREGKILRGQFKLRKSNIARQKKQFTMIKLS